MKKCIQRIYKVYLEHMLFQNKKIAKNAWIQNA